MITAQALAACLMLASQTYHVPPAVMIGIMHVEGGRVGQQVGPNSNGSYDLGPMQVNTTWIPQLAKAWGIDQRTARALVRDDGCVNIKVAAWILHKNISETRSLYAGIARYHSATPWRGVSYADRVVAVMDRKGLIKHNAPLASAKGVKVAQK